jgi:hypothetical protein
MKPSGELFRGVVRFAMCWDGFDIKHQGITCTLTGCEWMPLAITTMS